MHSLNILLNVLLLLPWVSLNYGVKPSPRMFGRKYTKTVVKPYVISSFIPSSCVQVDATLPPCRIMRSFLSFPSIEARSISNDSFANTTSDHLTAHQEPNIQTTPLSWGEYLGIYAPTVTVTSTHFIIATVVDPAVQVTYAIKGCRPKILPLNMDRCATVDEGETNEFTILPTSPVTIQPTSTLSLPAILEVSNYTEKDKYENTTELEGSSTIDDQEIQSSAQTSTQGLDEIASTVNP